MSKIIVIYAPSATGKTTLEENILLKLSEYLKRIVYYTTRKIREGEVNGSPAIFISCEEFNNKQFIATEIINDSWKYGISEDSILNNTKDVMISIISISYLRELYDYCKSVNIDISIFYLDLNKNERIRRLKLRGESESSIEIRLNREDTIIDKDISDLSMKKLNLNNKTEEEVFELFKTEYFKTKI